MWRIAGFAFLALGVMLPGGAPADQTDERLDGLFEQLVSVDSISEAKQVEREIWRLWVMSGRSDVDVLMVAGIRQMYSGLLDEALGIFDRVVEMAPQFAEGWNKRATVHYLKDNYRESVYDIRKTLVLEPRHFGAISGMGLILVETGDDPGAIQAFEEVLNIHPFSAGARQNLDRIRLRVQGRIL